MTETQEPFLIESKEDLQRWLDAQKWTFAKTMADIPHEYVVKQRVDPVMFQRAADYINTHGYRERFYSRWYTYYNLDGYKYFHITKVINRAKLPEDTGDTE